LSTTVISETGLISDDETLNSLFYGDAEVVLNEYCTGMAELV